MTDTLDPPHPPRQAIRPPRQKPPPRTAERHPDHFTHHHVAKPYLQSGDSPQAEVDVVKVGESSSP